METPEGNTKLDGTFTLEAIEETTPSLIEATMLPSIVRMFPLTDQSEQRKIVTAQVNLEGVMMYRR